MALYECCWCKSREYLIILGWVNCEVEPVGEATRILGTSRRAAHNFLHCHQHTFIISSSGAILKPQLL